MLEKRNGPNIRRMKKLLVIGLILTTSCSRVDRGSSDEGRMKEQVKSDTSGFAAVDRIMFKNLVISNDKLLGILNVQLNDRKKSERINKMIQSDSNRLEIYNLSRFTIKADKRCGNYRHLLISKERNVKDLDIEPYRGLFLVIVDSRYNVLATEKLEESSLILLMTSKEDKTDWNLTKDSLLTIESKSAFCSDTIVEGEGMTCWTDKVYKQYRLACDGLTLIKRDSSRTEKTE